MTVATSLGKNGALEALRKRREANRGRKSVNNSSLYAGSPMHFDCQGCNADIMVREDYDPPPPKYCSECRALKDEGWLE